MDKFITRKVVSTPQPKKSSNPDSSPPTKRKRGDGDASTDSDKSNVVDITVPSEPSCSSKGLETQQKTAKKDERGFSPHWFLYSVNLTEYVAMDPRVSVCVCVCVSVCLCVCLCHLYSPNEWTDFDETFHKSPTIDL